MKLRLSKKTKTFLSVATAIIASTAVTTLLTSCSSAKESDIIDTGGYDKEYGINDVHIHEWKKILKRYINLS